MGFFDNVSNFFSNTVGGFFKETLPNAFHNVVEGVKTFTTETIKPAVTNIASVAKTAVTSVAGTAKDVVSTLYKDGVGIVKDTINMPRHMAAAAGKTVSNLGGNAQGALSSIGNSFAMPLTIGAAAVAALVLLKK